LTFFRSPKDLRRNIIDNPLKVLDFIDSLRGKETQKKISVVKAIGPKDFEVPKEVPNTENKNFVKFGLDKFLKPGFFKPGPK